MKLSNFSRTNWDFSISKAIFDCNISFHRALYISPFLFTQGWPFLFPDNDLTGASLVRRSKEFLTHSRDKFFEKYIEKGKFHLVIRF